MAEEKKTYKKEFTPLPEGEYTGRLLEANLTAMKNGKGKKIDMKFEVDLKDGEKLNGKPTGLIFHSIIYSHKTSPKAVEYARKNADFYLKAVGVEGGLEEVGDDLLSVIDYTGTDCTICVGVEEAREYKDASGATKTAKPRNNITFFKAL